MRAAAHVDVFFVIIQTHGLLIRHAFYKTQLVVFVTGGEHLDHFGARGDFLDDVVIFFDQLLHALLDRRQVVRRERALVGDIVIEAVVDHRADDHFCSRVQLLDRMPHQVSAGVTDDLQPFCVLGGNDLQAGIVFDKVAGVDQFAVDFTGNGGLGQTGAD